ncbi:MAG: SDR family NAD(P)-dependent oxidoreductase [Acidimicrobiales bacterium]
MTGASSGMGRAAAVELAGRGARVMAVARRGDRLRQLADETGVAHLACDLSSVGGCEQAIAVTEEQLGPIEILVNNAATGSAGDAGVLDIRLDGWRATLGLNLDAPLVLTQLAARGMVAGGWGRIVMVASTAGQVGGAGMVAYCASKHGLLGLMRAAAADLAPHGVTCNAVLPGWVRTEMAERSAEREARDAGVDVEDIWRRRAASYPSGRLVTEGEVAGAIAFLASEEASGVNGEALTVAGGGLW